MTRARDVATQGGLVLITSTTITNSSAASVNNCFSSTYQNYRILFNPTSFTSTNTLYLRFRANGTDDSGNVYYCSNFGLDAGGTGRNESATPTSVVLLSRQLVNPNADWGKVAIDVLDPQIARTTNVTGSGNGVFSGNIYGTALNTTVLTTTQYDGFTIIPSAGTTSGTIKVYGYK